jgi:Cdc6-like AAA superfamily ATPase
MCKGEAFHWMDKKKKGRNNNKDTRRKYKKFSKNGITYRVGDFAFLAHAGEHTIGQIKDMWEDTYGCAWVSCDQFFLPEQTTVGRQRGNDVLGNEIFKSTVAVPEYQVEESVNGLCIVYLDLAQYRRDCPEGNKENESGIPVFFARKRYDPDRMSFTALLDASSIEGSHASGRSAFAFNRDDVDDTPAEEKESPVASTNPDAVYSYAVNKLQLSALPASIPCRDKEHAEMSTFLINGVKRGGASSALYVSGMPGAGKTCLMRQIVREMRADDNLPQFKYIEINGMQLPNPKSAYSKLWSALSGSRVGNDKALANLTQYFQHGGSRPCVVLLVDEIDFMMTRKQDVIYNILNWPGHRNARLVVVGIANTMDLPERYIGRVRSRLSLKRIVFPPYKREDLETIISARLQCVSDLFEEHSLSLCARKVASVSGDIRRALQMCRRAVELADAERKNRVATDLSGDGATVPLVPVTTRHIEDAIKDLFSSDFIDVIKRSAKYEKFLYRTLISMMDSQSAFELPFEDVAAHLDRLVLSKGQRNTPKVHVVDAMCRKLADVGILNLYFAKAKRYYNISLVPSPDSIRFALRQDSVWLSFNRAV